MAKTSTRVFAGVGAALFFMTSFGLTFVVLWQAHQNSQANKPLPACKTTKLSVGAINVKQGAKMQGSQLADFTPCTASSLQSIDVKVGTGAVVQASDTISVDYTGAVAATGTIFQSSLDTGQPVSFPLNQVIPGWTAGIPGMKVGGERRLLIPAPEAYGANPPQGSGIPANADLVFDITLHKIGS